MFVNKIISSLMNKLIRFDYFRNAQTINGKKVKRHSVNIEYSNYPVNAPLNLGDTLTPIVFSYLKDNYLGKEKKFKNPVHIDMIGSIIAFKNYDAVIWGSGLLNQTLEKKLMNFSVKPKYDVRAVRGPLTRDSLLRCGYSCPNVYGDPAILMPLIYKPKNVSKKYKVSVIRHYKDDSPVPNEYHKINIVTDDYRFFINELLRSELVVSSSLHALILAESYGIPTIWYTPEGKNTFKYMDWYLSFGEENPAKTNDLNKLGCRTNKNLDKKIEKLIPKLISSFPYEYWSSKNENK